MLFRGVIIEGTACAGKTSLLRTATSHPRFLDRPGLSSIVLTEHQTLGVLGGWGRSAPAAGEHVDLLRTHVDYLTGVQARLMAVDQWREGRRGNPRVRALVERFHLSHVLSFERVGWSDVDAFDCRLAEAGFVLCLVVASSAEIRRRLGEDRGENWATFLGEPEVKGRLGNPSSFDAQVDYFVEWQNRLQSLAERSHIPVVAIDTSERSPTQAAERLLEVLLGEQQGP